MSEFVTFQIYGMEGKTTIELIQGGPPSLIELPPPARLPDPITPLSSWPAPDPVQGYGKALLKCLDDVLEPAVKAAIRYAVSANGTIYFKFKATDWEAQAWEALWDESSFFLLTPQRGMARMVDPRVPLPSIFPLEQPLRIMAVLSAAGVESGAQWDALYLAATRNAGTADGLPVRLHVLTGEEDLADRIRELPRVDRLTVTVANIDSARAQTVSDEIKRFRPHILHFFCHGQVLQGTSMLRLSDIDQHRESMKGAGSPDAPPTSFVMNLVAFRDIIDQARTQGWLWLTVLNACKLGVTRAKVAGLTQRLAFIGVPAAIGMTEEIDENDASEFCGAFYSSLFIELANAGSALATAPDYTLDWAKLLHGPRMTISGKRTPATSNAQWTFPVMYICGYDFKFTKDRKATELAYNIRDGALQQLQQLRNTPADVVEAIAKAGVT